MAPSVNWGHLISRCFVFIDYFASNSNFCVYLSCINSPRLLSRSWVKVKRRSKLCEGQPLWHSALRCCLDICCFQSFSILCEGVRRGWNFNFRRIWGSNQNNFQARCRSSRPLQHSINFYPVHGHTRSLLSLPFDRPHSISY